MSDITSRSRVDDLIDRAIVALNRGDVDEAHKLAGEVLATDTDNVDATDLLAAQVSEAGEVRRLTVLFSDLVGSTELSSRLEPEAYRTVVVRYQQVCQSIIEERYDGSIMSFRGDGILASFGFPVAHENDVDRAVLAGLDLIDGMRVLSDQLVAEGHDALEVRVAVHKGLVFLDRKSKELYGFAVNVAARLESLAEPGTVLVSDELRHLLRGRYDLIEHEPRAMKGVANPLATFTVVAERTVTRQMTIVPLVGRHQELEQLRTAWAAACEGRRSPGDCIAIIGEPGIGKSRLAAALWEGAVGAGHPVIKLNASPLHTEVGLWPFRGFVEEQCGITRQTPPEERLALLRELSDAQGLDRAAVPLLAALLGIEPNAGYEADQSDARQLRERIAQATLDLLTSFASPTGTVILAEDLHWFDTESRDLLGTLIRADDPTALVVLTSRQRTDAPPGEHTRLVELHPLDQPGRLTMLRHVAGGALEPDLLLDLARRSDGVPLFLEELGRSALHPRVEAPVRGAATDSGVPEILYEALVARLQVDTNGIGLAAAAATVGREADHDLLVRISDLTDDALEAALAALVDGLVLETVEDDEVSGLRYRFRHDLLRAVAYDLQPPSRQRDYHGRVADALVDVPEGDPVDWAIVATHYEAAMRPEAAVEAYDQAASVARLRGALIEARALLGRAVEVAEEAQVDRERQVDLRLRRGFLSVSLEGNTSAQAAEDYERCLELAVETGPSDGLFATLNALWTYYAAKGDLDRAEELLGLLGQHVGPRGEAAQLLAEVGQAVVANYRGDTATAHRLGQSVVAGAKTLDLVAARSEWWWAPLDPIGSAHCYFALCRMLQGDPAGALDQQRETRESLTVLPFPQGPFSRAGYGSIGVWLLCEIGELSGAAAVLDSVEEIASQHGFDQWTIVATTQREVVGGLEQLALGPEADSAALSRHAGALGGALMMWKMVEQWVFVTYYTTVQGVFHAAAGERDAARAAFEEALAISSWSGMAFYDVETRRHLANLHDDPAERVPGLQDALALAREQGTVAFEMRVARDLHEITGDVDPLRAALAKFAPGASYPELEAARALAASA